jgi:hypothetical protein
MRPPTWPALLMLAIAGACTRHPTYGSKPTPAVATDTLNGHPRSPGEPRPPKPTGSSRPAEQPKDETDSPSKP